MNRFVFIIPFYNVRNYIQECCNSLLNQTNQNWIAILADDQSTDGTCDLIPKDNRFIVKRTPYRMTALPNIHFAIMESNLNDEDIICILDGDDYLLRADAIDIIDNLYQDDKTLVTYGQYVYSNGNIGHCRNYNQFLFDRVRDGREYWASHLRTFKYKLYKEILNQDPDLSCYKDNNGDWYKMTYDVAIMLPLLEMAGFDRVKFNPLPVYLYRIHPNNDFAINGRLQYSIADEIYAKKKFNLI